MASGWLMQAPVQTDWPSHSAVSMDGVVVHVASGLRYQQQQ